VKLLGDNLNLFINLKVFDIGNNILGNKGAALLA
jgi:hypothetical protein